MRRTLLKYGILKNRDFPLRPVPALLPPSVAVRSDQSVQVVVVVFTYELVIALEPLNHFVGTPTHERPPVAPAVAWTPVHEDWREQGERQVRFAMMVVVMPPHVMVIAGTTTMIKIEIVIVAIVVLEVVVVVVMVAITVVVVVVAAAVVIVVHDVVIVVHAAVVVRHAVATDHHEPSVPHRVITEIPGESYSRLCGRSS